MTLRSLLPLLPLAMLAACDDRAPREAPSPTPEPARLTNDQAARSIMQPEVIAETEPVEAAPAAPPPLPSATIPFAAGAALDEAGREAVMRLLADAALPSEARFVLRGHSDSQGSDADNLATSRRRAEAVRTLLIERGVAADRIEVIALGERRPAAPNATLAGEDDVEGRVRNRRVEIEVLRPEPSADGTDAIADPAAQPSPRSAASARQ